MQAITLSSLILPLCATQWNDGIDTAQIVNTIVSNNRNTGMEIFNTINI